MLSHVFNGFLRLAGGKEDPRLPGLGGVQAAVAIGVDVKKARLTQGFCQGLDGIGPLLVDLGGAVLGFPFPLEDVHAIGADRFFRVILRAPDAVGIVGLIQKQAAVQALQVLWGVHIKDKEAPGL